MTSQSRDGEPRLTTDRSSRYSLSTLAAYGVIFGVFALHVWLYRAFYIDDALISLRYVRQFVAGNGLVYNVGERVEGYSNFLWVILAAIFGWAQVDLIWATQFLGIIFGAGVLVVVAWFTRHLRWPWVAPALLVVVGPFAAWVMGGLETILFAFWLIAGSAAFVHEEENLHASFAGRHVQNERKPISRFLERRSTNRNVIPSGNPCRTK